MLATTASVITLVGSGLIGVSSASAETSSQFQVTSSSCVKQVKAIAAKTHSDPTEGYKLCTATVVVTESPIQVASVSDIKAQEFYADSSPAEQQQLLVAASLSDITCRTWTHALNGGGFWEVHVGKTCWDGYSAWIATHLGITGYHTCHAEGSWAVGWAIKPISCNKPISGSSADAAYRFDASVAYQGSPITIGYGLHFSVTKNGASSAWQVGG